MDSSCLDITSLKSMSRKDLVITSKHAITVLDSWIAMFCLASLVFDGFAAAVHFNTLTCCHFVPEIVTTRNSFLHKGLVC